MRRRDTKTVRNGTRSGRRGNRIYIDIGKRYVFGLIMSLAPPITPRDDYPQCLLAVCLRV